MRHSARRVLVIGYGNPGRLDDGLGPACAAAIQEMGIDGVTVDADYQLSVEDAAAIAEHEVVVFADASVDAPEPFAFEPVRPAREISFSTHSIEPPAVVALARDMFQARIGAFALGIRGYEFNAFGERISAKARTNLRAAVSFLRGVIEADSFDRYAGNAEEEPTEASRVVLSVTPADLN